MTLFFQLFAIKWLYVIPIHLLKYTINYLISWQFQNHNLLLLRITVNIAGNIQAVLSAASHLQILPVIGACAEFLHKEIDMENCVDIATISETFTLPDLQKHAYCFIGKHLDKLKYYSEFNQRLSAEQLEFLLTGDFPVSCSEAEVLEATLFWIHFDLNSRWQHHETLFACIHFDEIPLADMLAVFYKVRYPVGKKEYWDSIDSLQLRVARKKVVQREAEEAGLVNIRGMQKALVKVGGFQSATGATNTLTYLHSGSRVWHQLTSIPHLEQFDFGVTVLNNELYVTGGVFLESNQDTIHSYGFKYNPVTDKWSSVPGMNHDRCGFFLATVSSKIYAIGGNENGTCECYNPETKVWNDISGIPMEFDRYAGAVIGSNVYISGGVTFFTDDIFDILWQYDVHSDTWNQKAPMLSPRADHGMVAHDHKLYIAGGWSTSQNHQRILSPTLDVYDENLDQWQVLTHLPNPRYLASLTISQDKIYFTGGRRLFDSFYGASAEVDVYDLKADEWSVAADYPVEIWEHQTCELYIPLTREDREYKKPGSQTQGTEKD